MWSQRTAFIVFSLVVHGAFAFGIGELDVKKSHAATAIQLAEAKKPANQPPPAKIDPPSRKPEPPVRDKRVVAAKAPAEAPPPPSNVPPPAGPLGDLPDFGVSLSGGVDGTGIALPVAGSARSLLQTTRPALALRRLIAAEAA